MNRELEALKLERDGDLRSAICEREPRLSEVQSEYVRMREEIAHEERRQEERMRYLVDAGEIVSVRAVSPRDSAHLALTAVGDRAQFPITVHQPATGEQFTFVKEVPAKKPVARVENVRRKKARA